MYNIGFVPTFHQSSLESSANKILSPALKYRTKHRRNYSKWFFCSHLNGRINLVGCPVEKITCRPLLILCLWCLWLNILLRNMHHVHFDHSLTRHRRTVSIYHFFQPTSDKTTLFRIKASMTAFPTWVTL